MRFAVVALSAALLGAPAHASVQEVALPRITTQRATATLDADVSRSIVRWTGTKFRGRGKHEGTVRLASGALSLCGTAVCGGRFTLDMRSIAVTDIPEHETVPRTRLTNHLLGPDFFFTERHPTATFVLRGATLLRGAPGASGAAYRVSGDLTLRGNTRGLAFDATIEELPAGARRVTAALAIDRQRWGISYRFDPIRNEIVDDEIGLVLDMVFTSRVGNARGTSKASVGTGAVSGR